MILPMPVAFRRRALLPALLVLGLSGCAHWRAAEADEAQDRPLAAAVGLPAAVVPEAFSTPDQPGAEIDSVSAWLAPDGARWLIATGKDSHDLRVFDGDDGRLLRTVGGEGDAPGRFRRPNGVFVWGDRLFVVERDNRRVQVLDLPSFRPLATFGEGALESPYGLWLEEPAAGELTVWVTDSPMDGEDHDRLPPLERLDGRLQRFDLALDGDGVSARAAGRFGPTDEANALHLVESVAGDRAHGVLLVAEEDAARGTGYHVHDLEGRDTGRRLGVGEFRAQAEGIAAWTCPDGSGYWVAADQFTDRTVFRVFDRATLATLGAFVGRRTAGTDGLWIRQAPSPRFPAGVLYAADDDLRVSAFDWRDVARALGLRETCR